MAGESKSGENRLFQLMIVLITAVIGPLTVYFITNANKNADQPVITVTSAPIQATLPNEPGVVTAVAPTSPVVQPSPTVFGVQNPSGSLPAGTPALVDGLALWVDTNDVRIEGDYLRLSLHIRNDGASRRTLVYTAKSIIVKDDLGNVYDPFLGESKNQCRKADLDAPKNIQIEPKQEIVLQSPEVANAGWWCSGNSNEYIPLFVGPIASGVRSLQIQINGIGPFKGFGIEIGL